MAIAWRKKRGIHGAFNGPVSREFGSVNCEYEEQVDAELAKLVKEREGQPEIEANLELDDIFEIVANRSEGTKR
ncbi:hypothetical protein [Alteromonas sp. H39]|uniref:hypothetical protein n=1 Tax=Alteromonas sp. H39 TaxID=3389876 RepID=UPI0039E1BA4A